MPIWLPVDPDLTASKKLRVLVPLFGEEYAGPYPATAPTIDDATGVNPEVNYYETTVEAAAKLGVGGIFSMESDGFYRSVVMDTRVGKPEWRPDVPAGTKVYGTFWGFAVRVAMRIRSANASTGIELPQLAAAVQIGIADVQYSVSAVGIDRAVFAAALRGVPLFGPLDYEAFSRLRGAIDRMVGALVPRLTSDELLPISVFVENPFPTDLVASASNLRWVASRVARKVKLSDALAEAPTILASSLVTATYAQFGVTSTGDVPSDSASRAKHWLSGGL